VLLAMLAGAMKASMANAAATLNALPVQMARLAGALQTKLEAEGGDTAPADTAPADAAQADTAPADTAESGTDPGPADTPNDEPAAAADDPSTEE
jgi:large subunit ribosomal protein L10